VSLTYTADDGKKEVPAYQQPTACGGRFDRDDAEVIVQGDNYRAEDLILMIAALPSKIIVLIGMDDLAKMCGEPVLITKSRFRSDQKRDVSLPVVFPIPSCAMGEAA
jgi:hypothetical protein